MLYLTEDGRKYLDGYRVLSEEGDRITNLTTRRTAILLFVSWKEEENGAADRRLFPWQWEEQTKWLIEHGFLREETELPD